MQVATLSEHCRIVKKDRHKAEQGEVEMCAHIENHGKRRELGNSADESPGVEVTTCIESSVRNWRDPTRHANA